MTGVECKGVEYGQWQARSALGYGSHCCADFRGSTDTNPYWTLVAVRFSPVVRRMIYWDEWFACMHGESHAHITFAEASIATWAAAGIVSALGRFLARFGSFLLPVGMAMTFVWFQIGYWLGWYRPGPRLALTSSDILNFTFGTCLLVLFWFGPSVSAWLLALHNRKNRARLQLSTVFK